MKTWKVREGNLSQLHPPSTLMILHLVAFYTAKSKRLKERGSWIEIRNGNWSVVFGWLLHASFIRMKLNQNLSFSVPCFSFLEAPHREVRVWWWFHSHNTDCIDIRHWIHFKGDSSMNAGGRRERKREGHGIKNRIDLWMDHGVAWMSRVKERNDLRLRLTAKYSMTNV